MSTRNVQKDAEQPLVHETAMSWGLDEYMSAGSEIGSDLGNASLMPFSGDGLSSPIK